MCLRRLEKRVLTGSHGGSFVERGISLVEIVKRGRGGGGCDMVVENAFPDVERVERGKLEHIPSTDALIVRGNQSPSPLLSFLFPRLLSFPASTSRYSCFFLAFRAEDQLACIRYIVPSHVFSPFQHFVLSPSFCFSLPHNSREQPSVCSDINLRLYHCK